MWMKNWPPLLPMAVFLLVYAWSLNYGFLWDDSTELQGDLNHVLHRLQGHFRPIYYFSQLLLNQLTTEAYVNRLINLLLLGSAAFFAVRAAGELAVSSAPLVVTAIFLHPTYVYPATWISQRNDCYLLFFLFLALANVNRTRGFIYLLFSDISKTPWVLQNIWYAWMKWREGANRWLIAGSLLVIPLIIGQGVLFWSGIKSGSTSPMTQLTLEGAGAVIFTLLVAAAKIGEAIVLIHIPISAFYGIVPIVGVAGIALVYAAAWVTLIRQVYIAGWKDRFCWHLLLLAILMSIPFAANNDPRVFGPAIPFFYFLWAKSAGGGKAGRLAFVVIAALNVAAVSLNYRISDTGAYDAADAPDYTLCGKHEMQFPMERWRCDRSKITHEIVRRVNRFME